MRRIEFDPDAFEDLIRWFEEDHKIAVRVLRLIREVHKTPYGGAGKPEPLRHELQGAWSRRITRDHRLVYKVSEEAIRVLACRNHY